MLAWGIVFVLVLVIILLICAFPSNKSSVGQQPDDKHITLEEMISMQEIKIQQMESSLKSILAERNYLANQYNILSPKSIQLEAERTRLLTQIEKLSTELTECKTIIMERDSLNQALSAQCAQLTFESEQSKREIRDLRICIHDFEGRPSEIERYQKNRERDLKELFISKSHAFTYMSALFADYKLIDYENAAYYLEHKQRPAIGEGLRIRDLKKQTRSYLIEVNRTKYILNDLLLSFPELENYMDSSPSDDIIITEKDNISSEIWNALSDSDRSQLVLDNYIKRRKSKWEIGRDYELYVGYKYSLLGYRVDYFGSNNKLEDLGRDLIIKKDGEIGIIQCKYWSSKKLIHEKHIAQLYGTVVSYIIENNYIPSLVHGIFITNISLSTTAKKFANFLGIKYKEHFQIDEFPRIKCNLGIDEHGQKTKIYHLPTDQQYDNVKIENEGECFVFTVNEAEDLGFRHAYKWHNQ